MTVIVSQSIWSPAFAGYTWLLREMEVKLLCVRGMCLFQANVAIPPDYNLSAQKFLALQPLAFALEQEKNLDVSRNCWDPQIHLVTAEL